MAGMSSIKFAIRANSSVFSADEPLEIKDQAVMTLVEQELHILLKSLVSRRTPHDADPFLGDSHQLDLSDNVYVDANLVVIGLLPVTNEG